MGSSEVLAAVSSPSDEWISEIGWRCRYCGITKTVINFTKGHTECDACRSKDRLAYNHRIGQNLPMGENKKCATYLGIHIAERVLSTVFKNTARLPIGAPGGDFLCEKGFLIDVKSACLHLSPGNCTSHWVFQIGKNNVADYFLCMGFDDRESLTPLHVWLIPGNIINKKVMLYISNGKIGLKRFSEYERSLDEVINCCEKMRAEEVI